MPQETPEQIALERIGQAERDGSTQLDLSGLKLKTFPAEIGKLTNLAELTLLGNQLTSLPPEIGKLTNLTHWFLSGNQLRSLPPEIGKLTNLTALSLSGNQLTSLPAEIGKLTNLTVLYLDGNQLTSLPQEIGKLTNLTRSYLHGNDTLGLPPEVLGPTWSDVAVDNKEPANPADILAYYFRRQAETAAPAARARGRRAAPCTLNEAKILVVGEPGVGKTALVHWLVRNKKLANPQWTKGIKIARWKVPAEERGAQPIRVNVWDFGGQEIMQATHQFFLTERSLYILVLDSRENEEQSKIRYWLDKIRTFGGDSPVIVVLNKRDEGGYEPDESRLRKDYAKNLRDPFFRTVCQDSSRKHREGEGVKELREALVARVRKLDNVRQTVPPSYLKTKAVLEKEATKRKHLSRADYDRLCRGHKLNAADRSALLAYLKSLGTLFHYQSPGDHGPLPDTYVLDPTWVTKGVYTIITDAALRNCGGELLPADLRRIFQRKRNYPRKLQDFILAMMEADLFELCFRVPDPPSDKPGLRLIPELLPPNEPAHGIDPDKSLNIEYHYSYLPAGLIPRFVVRMHNAIASHTYWKNGVVLSIDDRRVLVRGSREEKKVFVSVTPREPASRRALTVVRQNLKSVHGGMRHLRVKEMIALPDAPHVTVDYGELLRYEKDEGPEYEWRPPGAERKYTMRELLEGIEGYRVPEDKEMKMAVGPLMGSSGMVFISYAWESKSHAQQVRKLADDLRSWGVDARIDQYEGENGPSVGWPSWMEKIIADASVVLMVCAPKYLRRVKKEEAPGKGLGATWEGHLIYHHLYESGAVTDKFRAVLFDKTHAACIPSPISSYTHLKLYESGGFETMYRALTGQPRIVAPPLGPPRSMPPA